MQRTYFKASTKLDALKTYSGVFKNTPEYARIERRKGTPVPSLHSPHAILYTADSFVCGPKYVRFAAHILF